MFNIKSIVFRKNEIPENSQMALCVCDTCNVQQEAVKWINYTWFVINIQWTRFEIIW